MPFFRVWIIKVLALHYYIRIFLLHFLNSRVVLVLLCIFWNLGFFLFWLIAARFRTKLLSFSCFVLTFCELFNVCLCCRSWMSNITSQLFTAWVRLYSCLSLYLTLFWNHNRLFIFGWLRLKFISIMSFSNSNRRILHLSLTFILLCLNWFNFLTYVCCKYAIRGWDLDKSIIWRICLWPIWRLFLLLNNLVFVLWRFFV